MNTSGRHASFDAFAAHLSDILRRPSNVIHLSEYRMTTGRPSQSERVALVLPLTMEQDRLIRDATGRLISLPEWADVAVEAINLVHAIAQGNRNVGPLTDDQAQAIIAKVT